MPRGADWIGREAQLQRVRELLAEGVGLVSVLGPGGSGKTTLARLLELPFVDLSHCTTAAEAMRATQAVAGDPPRGSFVLDNCEQVAGLAALVDTWCEGGAVVVATSRTPLELRREFRVELPPLAGEQALALLVARVEQLGVQVEPEQLAGLLATLDGLPLAIELCASRVATLGVAGVEKLLDRPLALLADRKARPERQSSLARTLEWSFELLGPRAQRVLPQVALLEGVFTLDDVAWIEGALDGVEELTAAHLLRREDGGWRMFEGVRAFASSRIETEQVALLQAWLLAHEPVARLLPTALATLRRTRTPELACWIDRVLVKTGPSALRFEVLGSVQATATVLVRHAQASMTAGDFERAARLLEGAHTGDPAEQRSLDRAWARLEANRHDFQAAVDRLDAVLDSATDPAERAEVMGNAANYERMLGRTGTARDRFRRALALVPELTPAQAALYANLGTLEHEAGDLIAAEAAFRRSGEVFQALDHPVKLLHVAGCRARVDLERGELETAVEDLVRVADGLDRTGQRRWAAWFRINEAIARHLRGDPQGARVAEAVLPELRRYQTLGLCETGVLFASYLLPNRAQALRDEVAERVEALDSPSLCDCVAVVRGLQPSGRSTTHVRLLQQLAEQAAPRVEVGDGWFRLPGKEPVDLRRRGAMRRILAALLLAEGRPLSLEEVFEAGWPGQSIAPDAAGQRVYTAVNSLRRLGLDDVLDREADGYRLDPLRVVASEASPEL